MRNVRYVASAFQLWPKLDEFRLRHWRRILVAQSRTYRRRGWPNLKHHKRVLGILGRIKGYCHTAAGLAFVQSPFSA